MNNQDSASWRRWRQEWREAVRASNLGSSTKVVLHALDEHQNFKTRDAYPSTSRLAAECATSRTTVSKALSAAKAAGFIEPVGSKSKKGQYGSVIYKFRIPDPVNTPEHGGSRHVKKPEHGPCSTLDSRRVNTSEHKPLNEPLKVKPHIDLDYETAAILRNL